MAAVSMLRYLEDVFNQPSFYSTLQSTWRGDEPRNNSHWRNMSAVAVDDADRLMTRYTSLSLSSAAHCGLATGLLLAFVLHARLPLKSKNDSRTVNYVKHAENFFLRLLFSSVSLLLTILLLPLLTALLLLLTTYRHCVHLLLSALHPSYDGLLDGTDAVWALEDDASKSIINVLAMFDVELVDGDFEPRLVDMLRRVVGERILATPHACPKFWQHRRRSPLGYFYWERQREVCVEEHIQYMTQDGCEDRQSDSLSTDEEYFRNDFYGMSESVLKALVSELANSPLPADNTATWEILVGRDPILEDVATLDTFEAMEAEVSGTSSRYRRYPVLFRVHHSMGDGVALIRLLLEALADKTPAAPQVTLATTCVNIIPRRTSSIESVSLIPCSAGVLAGDDVNIPDEHVVFDTQSIPIKIAVRSPSTELDDLFSDDEDSDGSDEVFKIVDTDWPVTDSFVTIADDVGRGENTIYFYKEENVINDGYEKLRSYSTPMLLKSISSCLNSDSSVSSLPLFESVRRESSARVMSPLAKLVLDSLPRRCESPLHNLVRGDSLPRCESPIPPFFRAETPIPRFDSMDTESTAPVIDSGRETPFWEDDSSTPVPCDFSILPESCYFSERNEFVNRTESPVPQIHRKKYDHPWNDALVYSQFSATNSKCRPTSPYSRTATPVPRNDNPIPRCNSPFQRSATPLCLNPTPKPRCISPLPKSHSPYSVRRSSVPVDHSPSSINNFQEPVMSNKLPIPCTTCPLLPTTDEKDTNSENRANILDKGCVRTDTLLQSEFYEQKDYTNEIVQPSSRYVRILQCISHRPSFIDSFIAVLHRLLTLATAPATLINQTLVRAADVNPLRGPPLTGRKVVAWYFDPSDPGDAGNLLDAIRRVKRRSIDVKFSDVLLAALSASLEVYFLGVGCDAVDMPASVTVAMPARMTAEEDVDVSKMPVMENRFSVALLPLPITPTGNGQPPYTPLDRLQEVCRHTRRLRASLDYHLNYWLMAVVSKYLPVPLLAPLLDNVHSTLVVSNVVGPAQKIQLGGYQLRDMAFWVPTRSATGVGVSLLSYAGRLQLGIVADVALVTCQQDADVILDGVVAALHDLEDVTAL